MRFNRLFRYLVSFGGLAFTFVLAGFISGCQSESSDPNPAGVTPTDSTKPGSKDSVKVNPDDSASLMLLSPKVGDVYRLGDSLHVAATVAGNDEGTINAVDVFLSPDGGQTWGALSDHSLPVVAQTSFGFSWKIPAYFTVDGKQISLAENNVCMIRIEQHNTGDSLKTSVSGRFMVEDTVFIRLTYPLGGESLKVGDTLYITWTTKDDPENPVDAVDVRMSPDSGKTWGYLRGNSITPQNPNWERLPWIITDSITVLGKRTNIVGNPGVCIRVEQYTATDPKKRFRSGMISISRP